MSSGLYYPMSACYPNIYNIVLSIVIPNKNNPEKNRNCFPLLVNYYSTQYHKPPVDKFFTEILKQVKDDN